MAPDVSPYVAMSRPWSSDTISTTFGRSLVSGNVLAPVRVLNTAARRLGGGDLSQRVPEPSRDEVGELGRTFNTMAEGLENAERQRKNLVADVSHELRTPLSNIQGYVEAIRRK